MLNLNIQLPEAFFYEEERCNHLISREVKALWAVELDLLNKLKNVCIKHNLTYFADSGTLLGAVRHKGFIPWDDDIDIMMPRNDYDKLISIASSEFKPPYFFQCYVSEKKYFRGHSQLRYDGSSAILGTDIFLTMHQGIFIDIFVYDSIPDVKDKEWENRLLRADNIFNKLYNYTYGFRLCVNPKSIFKQLFNIVYCNVFSTKDIYKEFEDLFRFYENKQCKQIACVCLKRNKIKALSKTWYRETIYLPFENTQLPAPVDYDKVLRTQYGDNYMIPQKSPSMHGEFLVLDPYNSYTEYLPKLRREYKKNGWKRIIEIIKSKLDV